MEFTFGQWTQELSQKELKTIFDTVFDLFLENDVDTLDELQADVLRSARTIMAAFSQLPADKRQLLSKSAISLLSIFIKLRIQQVNPPSLEHVSDKIKGLFGPMEK